MNENRPSSIVAHKGHKYGTLVFIAVEDLEGGPTVVAFDLELEPWFDSCSLYETLDELFWERYRTDHDAGVVHLLLELDDPVRNPAGLTRAWASKIAWQAVRCKEEWEQERQQQEDDYWANLTKEEGLRMAWDDITTFRRQTEHRGGA